MICKHYITREELPSSVDMSSTASVSVQWNEEKHRLYNIGGTQNPSVTTVCNIVPSKWVEEWRARIKNADLIVNYLATVGTIVHYRCANIVAGMWSLPRIPIDFRQDNVDIVREYYINHAKFPVTQYRNGLLNDVLKGVEAFTEWVEDYDPKPPIHEIGARKGKVLNLHPCEKVVHHARLYYAGTADLLCSIDNENWLVDLKFNDRASVRYDWQLTGYRLALLNMYPTTKFDHVAILNLKLPDLVHSRRSERDVSYYFSEKNLQERIWMMVLGGFYYENRKHPILGVNARRVFSYLDSMHVPIPRDITTNPSWQEDVERHFSKYAV